VARLRPATDAAQSTKPRESLTAAEITQIRVSLLGSLAAGAPRQTPNRELSTEASETADRLLARAVTAGLREIVRAEAEDLRRLQFSVQTELSDALLRANAAARAREAEQGGR
jgi:hypothetical protein